MKNYLIICLFLFVALACSKKRQVNISGHVTDRSSNTDFKNVTVVLREYDNAFEANSQLLQTTQTDAYGKFNFNFKVIKRRNYKIYLDSDDEKVINSVLFSNNVHPSFEFSGSNAPSSVELSGTSKSYYSSNYIKDQSFDSLIFIKSHDIIGFYVSSTLINQNYTSTEVEVPSGIWKYTFKRYLNGVETIEEQTLNFEIGQHYTLDVHY